MQDSIDTEPRESDGVWLNRPPTHDTIGYHPYVESEFAPGSGRCDKCAGGPDADIHKKPVETAEQLERVASALEELETAHEATAGTLLPCLERIAAALERLVQLREFEMGLEPGQSPEIEPDTMPLSEGEL